MFIKSKKLLIKAPNNKKQMTNKFQKINDQIFKTAMKLFWLLNFLNIEIYLRFGNCYLRFLTLFIDTKWSVKQVYE